MPLRLNPKEKQEKHTHKQLTTYSQNWQKDEVGRKIGKEASVFHLSAPIFLPSFPCFLPGSDRTRTVRTRVKPLITKSLCHPIQAELGLVKAEGLTAETLEKIEALLAAM